MGKGMSCTKPKVKDRFDLQPFVMRRLPIFWIMGPYGCGKATLACMLEKCNKYTTVRTPVLVKEEMGRGKARAKIIEECMKKDRPVPDEIIITLIKEHIFLNYATAKGFMFVGFPIHVKQAKLFETEICKVNVIIYCTLMLDSFFGRMITKYGDIDTEYMRQRFVYSQKRCIDIYNYYGHKTIKVLNNYPPEDTCMKLVSDLEDYWGFKFDRIYSKS